MKITDNGKGFDKEKTLEKNELRKMAGLKNFYTRAKMIGAEVNNTSVKNVDYNIILKKINSYKLPELQDLAIEYKIDLELNSKNKNKNQLISDIKNYISTKLL
jgi:hypothetical protein